MHFLTVYANMKTVEMTKTNIKNERRKNEKGAFQKQIKGKTIELGERKGNF